MHTIVAVGGEIDVYTAPKLRDKITELVGDGIYDLVIDMEDVEFLDSTGLGVLVGGLKKVRAHDGSLELVCTQERLLKIFRITGWPRCSHPRLRRGRCARCALTRSLVSPAGPRRDGSHPMRDPVPMRRLPHAVLGSPSLTGDAGGRSRHT